MAGRLKPATIRNFGGGWNVSDSDLNLSSSYQPVSENIQRGADGSFSPRWGYKLFCDAKQGTETTRAAVATNMATVNTQPYITITQTAHGYATGDHVTISGAAALNGIPATEINRTHGILVIDANNFRIITRVQATSTGTVSQSISWIRDTHVCGGNIIHKTYFNRALICFTDIGEIFKVDDTGAAVRIWDYGKANTLSAGLAPWRWCTNISTDTFKSTIIAVNGKGNDKPLQIKSTFVVEYLVDKATSSNAAVPRADYVLCMQGYVLLVCTEYGNAFTEISAKNTDGTFTREAIPADAVEIDLSTQTSTVEPTLIGGSRLRDKVYLAFYDRGMIGSLGAYNAANKHVPDFSDTIAEHGTVSHRTIVGLGNDIFMCDYAGVPSVSISSNSGVYVPVRLSELIGPAIKKHLASLSADTMNKNCFALYSKTDHAYMLFVPKYDEIQKTLGTNPILLTDALMKLNQAIVFQDDHKLFTRSYVNVSGAAAINLLPAANINGKRKVVSIIDENAYIIQLGPIPAGTLPASGGGTAMTVTPVNDETIVYAFEYNKELKIRRWTRYRDLNFSCGCVSQRGRVFLSKGGRIYKFGDNEEPVFADMVGNYDYRVWANQATYAIGDRVLDSADGKVYRCIVAHTRTGASFATYRSTNPNQWEEYAGEPIYWELETPWSDLKSRESTKVNRYIKIDSEGRDKFTVSCYTNKIQLDPQTYADAPIRSLEFTAGDTGGFGQSYPLSFSSGRRTRDEKVWPFLARGKLLRWRFSGKTTKKVRIVSLTMLYTGG